MRIYHLSFWSEHLSLSTSFTGVEIFRFLCHLAIYDFFCSIAPGYKLCGLVLPFGFKFVIHFAYMRRRFGL